MTEHEAVGLGGWRRIIEGSSVPIGGEASDGRWNDERNGEIRQSKRSKKKKKKVKIKSVDVLK